MALALGAALIAGTTGCDSERALAPDRTAALDPRIALDYAAGLDVGLDDAVSRLTLAFEDEATASALRAHLRELAGFLAAGDARRAGPAIARARAMVERIGPAPDAGAIGLVLDHASALLHGARREATW
jgi:hypothetical protein